MRLLRLGLFLLALTHAASAQQITGSVTDSAGLALPGATVFLEGTTRGDVADLRGRFVIQAPGPGAYLLVAAFVGYESQEQTVRVAADEPLPPLHFTLTEAVHLLPELVVTAPRGGRQRRLRIFTRDLLGRTSTARRARIMNTDQVSFERTSRGFRAVSAGPVLVENAATGFRTYVHLGSYEHYSASGGFRLAARVRFEETGPATRKQQRLRDRLFRGSMKHFLWAWHHGRLKEEGFYVHGPIEPPRIVQEVARAVQSVPVVVEFSASPDGAYRSHARRYGLRPPFSQSRQVSRISFESGRIEVASNGHPTGTVRQEGYWAFRGVGDAVPRPADYAGSHATIAETRR